AQNPPDAPADDAATHSTGTCQNNRRRRDAPSPSPQTPEQDCAILNQRQSCNVSFFQIQPPNSTNFTSCAATACFCNEVEPARMSNSSGRSVKLNSVTRRRPFACCAV